MRRGCRKIANEIGREGTDGRVSEVSAGRGEGGYVVERRMKA